MSFRFLTDSEWQLLREVRLGALTESPTAFLSSYETEKDLDDTAWQREVRRGSWLVSAQREGDPVEALVGATHEPDVGPRDRCLSYLWVSPPARRAGVATKLVTEMLTHLRDAGAVRAWLWVLDGNEPAHALYRKLGFASTGLRQPLPRDASRYEERFVLKL